MCILRTWAPYIVRVGSPARPAKPARPQSESARRCEAADRSRARARARATCTCTSHVHVQVHVSRAGARSRTRFFGIRLNASKREPAADGLGGGGSACTCTCTIGQERNHARAFSERGRLRHASCVGSSHSRWRPAELGGFLRDPALQATGDPYTSPLPSGTSWRSGRVVEGSGLENRRAQAPGVRIPPPPRWLDNRIVSRKWSWAGRRRDVVPHPYRFGSLPRSFAIVFCG